MNATQDASNEAQNKINKQLIEYNEKQNDLIFATRKRLFTLEHKHKLSTVLFSGLLAIQFIMVVALAVSHG